MQCEKCYKERSGGSEGACVLHPKEGRNSTSREVKISGDKERDGGFRSGTLASP